MAKTSRRTKPVERSRYTKGSREGKVRKEFWLDPKLLKIAKRELGAATEQEAIDLALDLVTFRREVLHGLEALPSIKFTTRS